MMIDKADKRLMQMKEVFETLYDLPVLKTRIKNDPVEFPHLYQDSRDIELAGFIASALAFGRIDLFKPVIRKILSFSEETVMSEAFTKDDENVIPTQVGIQSNGLVLDSRFHGNDGLRSRTTDTVTGSSDGRLYDYIMNFNPDSDAQRFDDMYYRMCKGKDIACLILMLREAVRKYGNLKNMFYSCYEDAANMKEALQRFTDTLRDIDTTPVYGRDIHPRGLLQLIPSPKNGGPCKRLNMFLRWMIRPDDGIDFGLWNKIPASVLIIPVDVHIARICSRMNMTSRKSANWAMAEEITDKFRLISPEDPLKYDFAICHLGITGKWKEVLFNEQ